MSYPMNHKTQYKGSRLSRIKHGSIVIAKAAWWVFKITVAALAVMFAFFAIPFLPIYAVVGLLNTTLNPVIASAISLTVDLIIFFIALEWDEINEAINKRVEEEEEILSIKNERAAHKGMLTSASANGGELTMEEL